MGTLTSAQRDTLALADRPNGVLTGAGYKPSHRLAELGLVDVEKLSFGDLRLRINETGRAVLMAGGKF